MTPNANPEEYQMDLMDHLRELRRRLFYSIIAVTVGSIVAYIYATEIFDYLCAPFFVAFPGSPLIATSPAEPWVLKIKASVFAGILGVSPFLFYQLWLFITPGLYDHERKLVLPFVFCSTALFIGGALFCYYAVLPLTLAFFQGEFVSIGVTANIKVGEYLSMATTALVGFGAVFEMPLLTYFLARAGIVDHTFLINWFRHAVIVIFVVAAILTPPDVLTQFLMAGPLLILYGISIWIAWLVSPSDTGSSDPSPPAEPS